jgi:hypothetical protein
MAPDSEPTPRVPWLPVSEGATPDATADALTPTKPVVPAWIQRQGTPEPEEVSPPPAEEVLPSPVDAAPDPEPVAEPEAEPPVWASDPVQLLGETAVASATLSAAGAPTPLGGVPMVPATDAVTPPSFGDEGEEFVPTFVDDEPSPSNKEKADALAAGILAHETERLATQGAELDGGAAYTPRVIDEGEPLPTTATAGVPALPAEEPAEPEATRRSRWWLWLLLAIIIIGAAVAAYLWFTRPAPVVVPGATVTEAPPSPTITPIAAPTASAFQAAMPTTVGTYALVDAVSLDPVAVADEVGRVADGVDLTYRSGDGTMTVRALQYYNEDDATAAFTQFANDPATTTPVTVDGQTVGESAIVTSPKPGMVWRNGTTVFLAYGPASDLAEFYALFGL